MEHIIQVIAVAGTAIGLSFGLARMILRQNEHHIQQHFELLRALFVQVSERLRGLEDAIRDLEQAIVKAENEARKSRPFVK